MEHPITESKGRRQIPEIRKSGCRMIRLWVPGNTKMDPLLRTGIPFIGGPEIHDLNIPGFSQIHSPGGLDFPKLKPPEAWISGNLGLRELEFPGMQASGSLDFQKSKLPETQIFENSGLRKLGFSKFGPPAARIFENPHFRSRYSLKSSSRNHEFHLWKNINLSRRNLL